MRGAPGMAMSTPRRVNDDVSEAVGKFSTSIVAVERLALEGTDGREAITEPRDRVPQSRDLVIRQQLPADYRSRREDAERFIEEVRGDDPEAEGS